MTQAVTWKVLLVEDSEPLRKILAEKLRDEHFEVTETGNGDEGAKIAIEQKPDLVITDLVMFPTDGIDMAIRIRESGDWGKHIHIIALTNQNMNEEAGRIERASFDAYFVKAETSLDEVVKQAKSLLKK
jgi:CheY-like chemotaxis protein